MTARLFGQIESSNMLSKMFSSTISGMVTSILLSESMARLIADMAPAFLAQHLLAIPFLLTEYNYWVRTESVAKNHVFRVGSAKNIPVTDSHRGLSGL